jgi:hypothetical protein
MFAGRAIGTPAFTEFQLARLEVRLELAPLLFGGLTVLGFRAQGPPVVEKRPAGPSQILVEDNGDLRYSNCRNAWPTVWFVG